MYSINIKNKFKLIFALFILQFSNLSSQSKKQYYSWGSNANSVIGNGQSGSSASLPTPQHINKLDSFIEIYTGQTHVYAKDKNNKLWAWGYNGIKGVLGINSNQLEFNEPTRIDNNDEWKTIDTKFDFTAGIHKDGTLWAWGRFLGYPPPYGGSTGMDETVPVKIDSNTNWIDVEVGYNHIIALNSKGELWSMGENTAGSLGISNPRLSDISKRMNFVMSNVLKIEVFGSINYAIDNKNQLYTWGSNTRGYNIQGDNILSGINECYHPMDSIRYTFPHKVSCQYGWKDISANNFHVLALKTDGTIWAWGGNEYGQLGYVNSSNSDTPRMVGNSTDWKSISTSGTRSYAIKENGTLWSWGRKGFELGQGINTTDQYSPKQVGNDSFWLEIFCSDLHCVASANIKIPLALLSNNLENVQIYPNPTDSDVHIDLPENLKSEVSQLKIKDLHGQNIWINNSVIPNNGKICISPILKSGIYILEIQWTNNQSNHYKIKIN